MGLACSSAISGALGGDITLKKSEKGLTSFAFKIPVIKLDDDNQSSNSSEMPVDVLARRRLGNAVKNP
jgi:hypothetical protein